MQKNKRSKPILGLLQTSKSHLITKSENKIEFTDIENQSLFDTMEKVMNDDMNANAALNHVADKNPILNKRILLKVNYEQPNNIDSDSLPFDVENDFNSIQNKDDETQAILEKETKLHTNEPVEKVEVDKIELNYDRMANENVIYDKIKSMKQYSGTAAIPNNENDQKPLSNEGRIVVYGDSNCLDSSHIEKPCFWLLDALLEYTMTGHVSTILKDLNRSPDFRFITNPIMPKRIPNNNLHMYSKVLMSTANDVKTSGGVVNRASIKSSGQVERSVPKCNQLRWETPIFLNISTPIDFYIFNGRNKDDFDGNDSNKVGELNLRRKLESQKGEVCSVETKYSISITFIHLYFLYFIPNFK